MEDRHHTGENFQIMLNESMCDFGIEKSKIHLFLRDAGSSMINATKRLSVDSVDCLAHKLHLVGIIFQLVLVISIN